MSWRIEPVNKNCIHERREFEGEHEVAISIYWRFGYIVVDEIPDLSRYKPDEGMELSSFEDWRFSDGSTELEIGAGTPPDEIENIKKAFDEDGEDALEMLGYQILDTNYRFLGKLKITDLTTEVIEQIKVDITNMEDIDDLKNALEKIDDESGLTDELKTDLYDKALRAGLEFGADVFNFEEYCELVSNTTGESALKFEALQQIRNNASGAHDLACAAKAAVEQLGDLTIACEIFDEGLNLAENKYDRIWLFTVALGCLNDADRAKNALSGFREEEADSRDCREIAEAIAKHSENKEWATNWYTKSLDLVADWEDQYRLIGSIGAYFKAPKLIKTAYERYSYLKSIGLGPKHAYRDYTDVNALLLLGPQGIATSDGDGVHTTEKCSLNEAWFWQAAHVTTLAFLLPGKYSGPIEVNTDRLSVIGLGNPEDIVISSDSENTIFIESGHIYLNNITIVRKDGEDAENHSAILVAGTVSLLVRQCVLTNPGGFAFAAIGEDAPLTEIVDCRIVDSANGVFGGSGRTRIDNVRYKNIKLHKTCDGGKGLLEVIEDRHRKMLTLVANKLFFNLYEFDDERLDRDEFEEYRSREGGDLFERIYYACALKQDMPEGLCSFFADHLPDDFMKRIFSPARSAGAFLGIYNLQINKLFAIGLGRNGRVSKKASEDNLDWNEFFVLDHANIADALIEKLEEIGRLHWEYLKVEDKNEKEELRNEITAKWQAIRCFVPTLPDSIADVCDLALGSETTEAFDPLDSGMSARQLAEFVMRLSVYRKSLYPDAMMVQARGFASFDNQTTVVKGVVKLVDPDNDSELESEIDRAERYFEAVLDAAGNQPMQFNIVVGGDNDPVSSLNITPQKSNTWLLIVEAQGKALTLIAVGGTPEGETEPQAFRYPDELDQIVKYTGVPAHLLT